MIDTEYWEGQNNSKKQRRGKKIRGKDGKTRKRERKRGRKREKKKKEKGGGRGKERKVNKYTV